MQLYYLWDYQDNYALNPWMPLVQYKTCVFVILAVRSFEDGNNSMHFGQKDYINLLEHAITHFGDNDKVSGMSQMTCKYKDSEVIWSIANPTAAWSLILARAAMFTGEPKRC